MSNDSGDNSCTEEYVPSFCQFCAREVRGSGECTCITKQKESKRIRTYAENLTRKFESGATRDTDSNKLDYEAFLSPLVLRRYAEYLHRNRKLKDGTLRDGDNWQLGIPITVYFKSLWRHFMEAWTIHRHRLTTETTTYAEQDELEDALCAILFNVSGYLHEQLKKPLYLKPVETPEAYATCETPPPPTYGWDY
jgi:hypothetical protein